MAYEDPPLTPPKGRGRGWGSVSDINQESALDENTDTHFFTLVETPYLAHDVWISRCGRGRNRHLASVETTQAWSANLVSALTNDAAFIQEALGRVLPTLALHGPATVIVLGLLLQIDARLLLGILLLGLPLAIGVLLVGRRMRMLTRRGQQLLSQTAVAAQESFNGLRLIKAMTRESLFVQRFINLTEQHFKFKQQITFWQALLSNIALAACRRSH